MRKDVRYFYISVLFSAHSPPLSSFTHLLNFHLLIIHSTTQPAHADSNEAEMMAAMANDTSLTIHSGFEDFESSARLIAPSPAAASTAVAVAAKPAYRAPAELVRMPGRVAVEERISAERQAAPEEPARHSARNWRSEAWERERERELRAATRLRSNG